VNAYLKVDKKGLKEMGRLIPGIRRQMPFIQTVALNRVGFDVHKGLGRATTVYYEGPRTYSQKAFRYKKANKRNLIVTVGLDKTRGYLEPTILGGRRKFKKAEGYLKAKSKGSLGSNIQLTPVKAGRTKGGDINRLAIRRAIANMSTKNQEGGVFFGTPRGLVNGRERDEGVWIRKRRKWQKRRKRHVGKLQPLFKESDPADYKPNTFPMYRLGQRIANRSAKEAFNYAFTKALETYK